MLKIFDPIQCTIRENNIFYSIALDQSKLVSQFLEKPVATLQ